jgi:alpha-amylase
MTQKLFRYGMIVVVFALLVGCGAGKPKAVQSIEGLPQGTDGFAWWNDTVFYEIFVRSFYDSNGDGSGDINGIIEKLDYLNDGNPKTTTDLGVTGLWLMPIHPSPSYHGYDVTDYYAVNKDYGTLDDFKRLVEEAHKRGIRIIIDLVLNHTSIDHPWFQESRDPNSAKRNWYIWSAEKPDYRGPWDEQVWYQTTSGYYYAIFWSGMPDLNYTNPEVTTEMQNVANYWLKDMGVDGFRLDAARYLIEDGETQADTPETHAWWQNFRLDYKSVNPQAMTVGEVWETNSAVEDYLRGNELDLAFNFDLASQILEKVNGGYGLQLRNDIRSTVDTFKEGTYATFLTNHDQDRVMTQLGVDWAEAKLAATVLLTTPGTPFIYYGEEIGMQGLKPDELIRTPMQWTTDKYAGFTSGKLPWETVNKDYEQVNVATETADPESLLSLYRTLIQLRNNHVALRTGSFVPVDTDAKGLLTFLRTCNEETVLVIINLSDKAVNGFQLSLVKGPLSGKYKALLMLGTGKPASLEANANGGFDPYQPVPEIPANGSLIIQLVK